MVDFFDHLYNRIADKNSFLRKIRFYSFLRVVVRVTANLALPLYFLATKNNATYTLLPSHKTEGRLIVSLTTFPKRINRIWIVIESILRQSQKPDMIILWLSKDQVASMDKVPKSLRELQKRGLDIRLCPGDLKSHKKYYYTLQEYPRDYLITIDDDIIYPSTMIRQLTELYNEFPGSVCCHRACLYKTQDRKFLPYPAWPVILKNIGPSHTIFLTSGGGTLFPPGSLHHEVLNESVFKEICFFADDIWLNAMIQLKNPSIVKSNYNGLLPVINFNNTTLQVINVVFKKNDTQLEDVRNHCIQNLGMDPFYRLFQ